MHEMIFPEIFSESVRGFFTTKRPGTEREEISSMISIRKDRIYLPIQKHTDTVIVLDNTLPPVVADAVVTREKGILVGVQVADCVPILLADTTKPAVGAVHAGWRGTAMRILQKTIAVMAEQFGSSPDDIVLALGPCIKGGCYPVDTDVKDAVHAACGEGDYYTQRDGKYFIDLAAANYLQATAQGIHAQNIWVSPVCTHCQPENYYSFRYSRKYNGSQGGFIGIF